MARFINVSVIIPVYNNSDGLKKVLESLVQQNFPNNEFQIIIADNGSSDGSLDVAKEYRGNYPQLVNYVIEDKIQSSYAARNKGIGVAKGQVLAFTDSDCIPAKDWLRNGFLSMDDSGASMVAGRIEMTYKDSAPNIWEYIDTGKLNQRSYVENAGFGATANLFVRRNIFSKYGLFRNDLQSGGDYEFGRRLTKMGEELVYVSNAVVYHPARASFKTRLEKTRRVAKGQKQLAAMGLVEHTTLSWRNLIPIVRCPPRNGVSLNRIQRPGALLAWNFFKYYNLAMRL